MSKVIAILCADIHLSEQPPIARSMEPDWLVAQARPLQQVKELVKIHKCPVICAGDIFDRHRSSPYLINWAMDNLPQMYAIPGQHDLPMHSYEDIQKSAYWTLVKEGTIENLGKSGDYIELSEMGVFGFPWASVLRFVENDIPGDKILLAVVHSYIWIQGKQYPGASIQSSMSQYKDKLQGYDAAVFGDNHQGFLAKCGDCNVLNCGCLIPRKSDERKFKPAVGLLHSDGTITQSFLDCSEDVWLDEVKDDNILEENEGLNEFLTELNQVDSGQLDFLDFRASVLQYLNDFDVTDGVRKTVLEVLGE